MILALETSTRRASLALMERDSREVVAERRFETERAHNAAIFAPLCELLDLAGESLSRLVVGLGPGSYGGVRVAIAAANGIALVRGTPTEGISSLRAWEAPGDDYHVLADARRRSYALATVRGRELAGEPRIVEAEEIEARLERLRAELPWPVLTADAALSERFPGVGLCFPSAARLGALAAPAPPRPAACPPLEPHYLRPPFITQPKPRQL